MPNLGILKTLSICYYRIATEQEKDRKEAKRNVLYQRYREASLLFIFTFNGLLYFILFEDLKKEVRGGKAEVSFIFKIYKALLYVFFSCGHLEVLESKLYFVFFISFSVTPFS